MKVLIFFSCAAVLLVTGCSSEDSAKYLDHLDSPNVVVQHSAIARLGKLRDASAVPMLKNLLSPDNDNTTRQLSAAALGAIGSSNVLSDLVTLLDDDNSALQLSAAEALGKIGDEHAIGPLTKVLRGTNSAITLTAIWALGNIGDSTAVPALSPLLASEDKFIRYNASQALKRIGNAN